MSRFAQIAARVAVVAAAGALAACASPPAHFYTLSPLPMAAAASATSAPWLLELAPVDVPPQVAKNQLVVQTDPNRVDVLEQERWASLPGDEIRRALSGDLTQQLGTIDVYGTPHPQGVPVYRVSVNVQRFESWPGSHALLDAVWSVHALNTQTVLTCRSVLSEPAGAGYERLVDAHRQAVGALAGAIASGVREVAAAGDVAGSAMASARKAPLALPCPQAVATVEPAAPVPPVQ